MSCNNWLFFAISACASWGFFVFLILGLPIQVRDAGLSLKDEMPKSDVNKEYYTQNMEREVKKCCYDLCVWRCTREGGGLTHFP